MNFKDVFKYCFHLVMGSKSWKTGETTNISTIQTGKKCLKRYIFECVTWYVMRNSMLILAFLKMNEQRRPDFPPSIYTLHKMHGPPVLLDLDWMVMGFVLYFPKISPQNIVLAKICDIIKIVEDQLWYTNAYNVQTQLWCNRAHRYIPTIKREWIFFHSFSVLIGVSKRVK